jgi:hypothetical protein
MPTTTALVPITHPDTGKPYAAGESITLSDEDYYDLRSDGKVAASDAEVKAHATPEAQGNYGARTGRSDTPAGAAAADTPPPGPSGSTRERDDKDHDRDNRERVRR